MSLVTAIEAFNQRSQPPIELRPGVGGAVVARLPRLGKEVVVRNSKWAGGLRVSAQDIALLCEEAQLAVAPGMALLEAALEAMGKVARDQEDELT